MISLHDAYELGGVAGHGRATIVRLGVRRGDAAPVALKQLRIEHAQDPDKRARFILQARQACMLHHDGIEITFDVVEGKDGPVSVTEWVDGRSLERLAAARRRSGQAWSAEEIGLVAHTLLEALRYAHHQNTGFESHGMVHGGLWPGNVMVDTEGHIKLVDFGIASVWQEAREPWQDLESLRYLSADHVRHGASATSDLYAVGAIVHELLAGTQFRAEHHTEEQMRAAIERPDPPPQPRMGIPAPLERLRHQLLEPIQSSRLMLEQALDLCAAIPQDDARTSMRSLVRDTLRNDSTSSDSDTPPRGIEISSGHETPPDGIAKVRSRAAAKVHFAAGGRLGPGVELRQVPLGQVYRPARRDTQSVPIPVDHEQTAARTPMFLQQTARPVGEQTRNAERERSGGETAGVRPDPHDEGPIASDPDDDTEPLSVGDLAGVPEAVLSEAALAEPNDLEVTAEVTRAPRLPEDDIEEQPVPPAATQSRLLRWMRGPFGWALLGATVVGIGMPLVARCNADADRPAPSKGR